MSFCEADREEIWTVRRTLRQYELVSGLKVNLSKSVMIGTNLSEDFVSSLALIMGCAVAKLPMKYLGLSIGENTSSHAFWDPVVENFEKKLSMWSRNYLY